MSFILKDKTDKWWFRCGNVLPTELVLAVCFLEVEGGFFKVKFLQDYTFWQVKVQEEHSILETVQSFFFLIPFLLSVPIIFVLITFWKKFVRTSNFYLQCGL